MRTRLAAVMALALALSVIACGDDDVTTPTTPPADDTSSTQDTTAPDTTAPTTTTPPTTPPTTVAPPVSVEPPETTPPDTTAEAVEFGLSSPAFEDGGDIDIRYSCDGDNISPVIDWTGVPAGTTSLALTVTDPDAEDFLHWVAWNIPADSTGFPEDVPGDADLPDGTRQGANEFAQYVVPGEATPGGSAFKTIGYDGPCPGGPHTYRFSLFALTGTIDLPGGTAYGEIQDAIGAAADDGSLIAEISISGIYTPAG